MFTSLRNLVNRALPTDDDAEDDETTEETHEPHTPKDFELLTVRSFLLRFLPMELANAILDAAEYWPVVAEEKHTEIHVTANHSNDNNAGSYCLVTPTIPLKARGCNVVPRVRCIKFKLVSHDQGWGGEGRYHGS